MSIPCLKPAGGPDQIPSVDIKALTSSLGQLGVPPQPCFLCLDTLPDAFTW